MSQTGGSRTIPTNFDIQLTVGYRMLAAGGDYDIYDTAPMHHMEFRPTPLEDCPVKARMVEEVRRELLARDMASEAIAKAEGRE